MNVAVLDLAEAEAEAADVNVGEDEQGCGVELDALLQHGILFSAPQCSSKGRLGGGCSGGGGMYMGGWLKYDLSKLEKDALCGVSIC
jgi:hypothetical protein